MGVFSSESSAASLLFARNLDYKMHQEYRTESWLVLKARTLVTRRSVMRRAILVIFWLSVIVATILISILSLRNPDDQIYSENVGTLWIDIWIEKSPEDPDFGKLAVMTRRSRFQLINSISHIHSLPGIESATFSSIYDHQSHLICIFDNNNCGFIMIVHDGSRRLCVGHSRKYSSDLCPGNYKYLKAKYPRIPYSHYFEGDSDTVNDEN